MVETK